MNKHVLQLHKPFTDPEKIEYWDSLYEQTDFYGESFRQRRDTALSWLNGLSLSANSKILDAGCGAGRLVNDLAKMRFNVFGMDYSYGMLVRAKSMCDIDDECNSAFCQGNIEVLPLKESSFDVIISLGVLAYLNSYDEALNELARALKPGGVLIVSIINKARIVSRLDLPVMLGSLFHKIMRNRITTLKDHTGRDNEIKLTAYFIPKFRKSLEMKGFTVLEYTTIPIELFTFFGRDVFPRKMTVRISRFFERFSNIPFIDSLGAMCVIKAVKKPSG